MEIPLPKYVVKQLTKEMLPWFIETAAVRMLVDELKRPELLNIENFYSLGNLSLSANASFIVYADDEPVGAIGGILVPNLFNPSLKTLCEIFWYVSPDHRNTRAGYLLLKALSDRAEEIADELTVSLLPSSEVNIDALEKKGFKFEELAFRKRF